MKTLLEKKDIQSKLKKIYNSSEKRILSFMHSNELELLDQYISLFDQVTKIDLELGNISNNKRSLPHWNALYGTYIPSLKSILESYGDWKLICSCDIFGNDDAAINFSKVRKHLQKSSNPLLAKKLDLKLAMWEKEKKGGKVNTWFFAMLLLYMLRGWGGAHVQADCMHMCTRWTETSACTRPDWGFMEKRT